MDPNYFLPIDDSEFDPTEQNLQGTVTSLSINQSTGVVSFDFSDAATLNCQLCNFVCSNESELDHHTRLEHLQEGIDFNFSNNSSHDCAISEVQRQLASSLLALANDDPAQNELEKNKRQDPNIESIECPPIYLCSVCSKDFNSAEDCKAHIKSHGASTKESSKQLHSKTNERKPKTNPCKVANNEVKCQVKGCQYRFSKANLQKHVECHNPMEGAKGNKNPFSCSNCSSTFKNWRSCALHLWKQHKVDVDLITCPVCKEFKTLFPASLQIHMLTHSEARRFVCSVCKKGFKQLAQLQNHSVIHLDKGKDMVPPWYSKKLCEQCSKYFADSKSLKKHIQAVHTKLKPYICQVCNHQSSRKSMLEMHMRQHTGEKPYSCDTCDYKTGDHNSLRRHKLRHLGQTLYQCPFCSYGSIQSSSYKDHVLKKHPDNVGKDSKVFICTDCLFKTVSLEAFISHQTVHKSESMTPAPSKGLIEPTSIPEDPSESSSQNVETVFYVLPVEIGATQNGYVSRFPKETLE